MQLVDEPPQGLAFSTHGVEHLGENTISFSLRAVQATILLEHEHPLLMLVGSSHVLLKDGVDGPCLSDEPLALGAELFPTLR